MIDGNASPDSQDLYARWLNIPPGPRPPDHYTLLGLPLFTADLQEIEAAAHRLLDLLDVHALHLDPEKRAACQRLMNEVAQARSVLADPQRRVDYDCTLLIQHGVAGVSLPTSGDLQQPASVSPLEQPPEADSFASIREQLSRPLSVALLVGAMIAVGSLVVWVWVLHNREQPMETAVALPAPAPAAPATPTAPVALTPPIATQSTEPASTVPVQAPPATAAPYARLTDLLEHKVTIGSGSTYYTPLEEGRWCIKFSEEQYAAARAANLLNDTPNADFIRTKFDCTYHPGFDPNVYWLCIENHGGDDDYNDVVIHVTDHQNGTYLLDIWAGLSGGYNSIISKPDGLLLLNVPSNSKGLRLTISAPAPALPPKKEAPATMPAVVVVSPPAAPGKELILNVGGEMMRFVYIPPGKFTMGSPDSEGGRRADEGPQHEVIITKPFYMGVTEVTQAQYEAVMGTNPSKYKGATNPVEMVSWNDATEFCKKLSQKTRRKARLPTEAEWEYACRAGTTAAFSFGDDDRAMGDYAWYNGNSGGKTHPVGQKKPNAWGLYDMHGNVWEWCANWHGPYAAGSALDPQGPASGLARALRGGSWYQPPLNCRAAYRSFASSPVNPRGLAGLRLVVEESAPTVPAQAPPVTNPASQADSLTRPFAVTAAGNTPFIVGPVRAGEKYQIHFNTGPNDTWTTDISRPPSSPLDAGGPGGRRMKVVVGRNSPPQPPPTQAMRLLHVDILPGGKSLPKPPTVEEAWKQWHADAVINVAVSTQDQTIEIKADGWMIMMVNDGVPYGARGSDNAGTVTGTITKMLPEAPTPASPPKKAPPATVPAAAAVDYANLSPSKQVDLLKERLEVENGHREITNLSFKATDGLVSIRSLKGFKLTHLNLGECKALASLTGLEGMPLTNLSVYACRSLTNLEPLRGIPLVELYLAECSGLVGDLSVLKGMKLTELNLGNCKSISSLSGIEGMPLTKLSLYSCSLLANLEPLRGMPLVELNLAGTKFRSPEVLAELKKTIPTLQKVNQ